MGIRNVKSYPFPQTLMFAPQCIPPAMIRRVVTLRVALEEMRMKGSSRRIVAFAGQSLGKYPALVFSAQNTYMHSR